MLLLTIQASPPAHLCLNQPLPGYSLAQGVAGAARWAALDRYQREKRDLVFADVQSASMALLLRGTLRVKTLLQ